MTRFKIVFLFSLYAISFFSSICCGCGPFFPNSILGDADEEFFHSPRVEHTFVLALAQPVTTPWHTVHVPEKISYLQFTSTVDIHEVSLALQKEGVSSSSYENIIAEYSAARERLVRYFEDLNAYEYSIKYTSYPPQDPLPKPVFPADITLPKGLPEEFTLYFNGAYAWHHNDTNTAQNTWLSVLQLPEEKRRYRSVWAAYMCGKSYMPEPEKAIQWFRTARAYATNGFYDSLGLAAESLGWQARAHRQTGEDVIALRLYYEQYLSGNTRTAYVSMQCTARDIIGNYDDEQLKSYARDPLLRILLTESLVENHFRRYYEYKRTQYHPAAGKWLKILDSLALTNDLAAPVYAQIAYGIGDYKQADSWCEKAPEMTPLLARVKAKLLLRKGHIKEALPLLSYALQATSDRMTAAELGILKMSQDDYFQALPLFLMHNWWWDAAYIAERVLTIEELRTYVDSHLPAVSFHVEQKNNEDMWYYANPEPQAVVSRFRFLLARRLARNGFLKEALPYYPAQWKSLMNTYINALQTGNNLHSNRLARGIALWKAARIMRYNGMELFGTECEPDWFTLNGNYQPLGIAELRFNDIKTAEFQPTTNEYTRFFSYDFIPLTRFHYREIAIEMAREAVEFLPDEDPFTARALCEAGSWLKVKNPHAADVFYKALVNRCGSTELGKKADKKRWFPEITPDKNY